MLVTPLKEKYGYDLAAKVAKNAHKNGTTLKVEALALGISEDDFDAIVVPAKMIGPAPARDHAPDNAEGTSADRWRWRRQRQLKRNRCCKSVRCRWPATAPVWRWNRSSGRPWSRLRAAGLSV
jgi:hypothetical protein